MRRTESVPGSEIRQQTRLAEAPESPRGQAPQDRAPIVLAGDFNVVPTPSDIYTTKSWDKDALVQPEGRKLFADLLAKGWTDALRETHSEKAPYRSDDESSCSRRRAGGCEQKPIVSDNLLAPANDEISNVHYCRCPSSEVRAARRGGVDVAGDRAMSAARDRCSSLTRRSMKSRSSGVR